MTPPNCLKCGRPRNEYGPCIYCEQKHLDDEEDDHPGDLPYSEDPDDLNWKEEDSDEDFNEKN